MLPQKHIIKSGGVAKRALISNNDLLWPDGIIYYTIDALFTGRESIYTYILVFDVCPCRCR